MVDKLYVMLPEFRTFRYNMAQARKDYAAMNNVFKRMMSVFTHSELAEDFLSNDTEDFKKWFSENKEKYRQIPVCKKIKYDYSKEPKDNSLQARNNLYIDMIWGVLTNSDTAGKMLNPGGFDYQKRAARITSILNAGTRETVKKSLLSLGIELNQTIEKNGQKYPKPISAYLFDLSLEQLDNLYKKIKPQMDPISPATQVMLHNQNMTGAKLIGIYANHNANHAITQYTALELHEKMSFTFNGINPISLHEIKNSKGEFISRLCAGFLAASVDNVKDPVLAALNQNLFTADVTMLLTRLGYGPIEVGVLLNQPIILEITKAYFRESRSGKRADAIIDEILNKYKQLSNETGDSYDSYKTNPFLVTDLAEYILTAKTATTDIHSTKDYENIEFYKKQVSIGYLFKRMMEAADELKSFVSATRADTQNGAAGPTIADTQNKLFRVRDVMGAEKHKYLHNYDVLKLYENLDFNNTDALRETFMASPLPYMQAFYTLGVESTMSLFAQYFPHFLPTVQNIVKNLSGYTRTGRLDVKTMNSIYNDLFAYVLSKTPFFGADVKQNMSAADKRGFFINNFPEEFKKIVTENPDIARLEFIRRLQVKRANKYNPVKTLVFKNVGRLTPLLREKYSRDWASLLYMDNEAAHQLAVNLFRYSFYRNGFAFGPSTFIHLAPVAIRQVIPGYVKTLEEMLGSTDDYIEFIDQYMYNHLDNRKLVPEVPADSKIVFTEGKNDDIKSEISFVLSKNSDTATKTIIHSSDFVQELGYVVYYPFRYICKKIRGKYVYYTITSYTPLETGTEVTFRRVEPLGFKNSFIEYAYGQKVEEMKSVIGKNDKTVADGYNSDTATRFNDGDSNIDDGNIPTFDNGYMDSLASSFTGNIIHPVDTGDSEIIGYFGDNGEFSPNYEYEDADGQKACGPKG